MTDFNTKLHRIGYFLKHDFLAFDNVILVVAAVFCLVWTWGAISSMSRNWALAEELMEKQRQKALVELEVEALELENAYYSSAEYQELAARKYQNKQLAGETMIYLPANSDVAKNKHKEVAIDEQVAINELSNLEQWAAFLFGFQK